MFANMLDFFFIFFYYYFFNDKRNRIEAKGTVQGVDSTAPGEGKLRRSRSSSARLPCQESLEYNKPRLK